MINRRTLGQMASRICLTLGIALAVLSAATIARAAEETPDAFITRVSTNVLETIKADKTLTGDVDKIVELVDSRVMPYINFVRMTASAVGPAWRQATPEPCGISRSLRWKALRPAARLCRSTPSRMTRQPSPRW